MRLIYLAPIRLPSIKAHSVQIINMCAAFAGLQGISVNLVVPKWRPTVEKDPFLYYGIEREISITKITTPRLAQFGKLGFLLEAFFFAVRGGFYCLFAKSEIVYSRSLLPLLFLSGLGKSVVVWETHSKVRGRLSELMIKILGKTQIKIVTITEILKSDLIKLGINSENIIVSPDGVDLSQYKNLPPKATLRKELGLSANKLIVSYVGRYRTMGQEKGVGELIEAYSKVERSQKQTFLLLVGIHEGERLEVEQLMKIYAISNYSIRPVVPPRSIPRYLCASDLLVMNYPSSDHFLYYMSPLKMFEYMASGEVIVSTDLPSVREVLNSSNALLVPPNSPELLATGILELLSDRIKSKSLADRALVDVHKYSWDKRAQNIIDWI